MHEESMEKGQVISVWPTDISNCYSTVADGAIHYNASAFRVCVSGIVYKLDYFIY